MKKSFFCFLLFCTNILTAQDIDSTVYIMEPFKVTVVKNNEDHGKYRSLILSELAGKVDTIWPQDFWVPIWFISNMKLFEQNKLVIITYGSWLFRYNLIVWDGKRWNISMSYNLMGITDKPSDVDIELVNYNCVKYKYGDEKTVVEYDIEKKAEKHTVIKE